MPGATTKHALPYSLGTDLVASIDDTMSSLANTLDTLIAVADKGVAASRPVSTAGSPGKAGRFYYSTDVPKLELDTGTEWVRIALSTEAPPDSSVTDAKVSATAAIAESKLALASDAAAATASRRTLGAGATQAAPGNDARLSNARTPTTHAASHEPGGSDALGYVSDDEAVALKVIRGRVSGAGAATGAGFTVTKGAAGIYTINFTAAFSAEPTVVASPRGVTEGIVPWIPSPDVPTGSSALIRVVNAGSGSLIDAAFSFIAIGPR